MARLQIPGYVAAVKVASCLREAGYEAMFAGGCVRDLLLGVEPKDFDVATSATPDVVQGLFRKTEAVGAHFGVVLVLDEVVLPPGLKPQSPLDIDGRVEARPLQSEDAQDQSVRVATEVATFRHDVGYADGRRPESVRYSQSAQEDVARRDFTINGLLLDVARFEAGEALEDCVLDYVGGREDLRVGVVRAIGEPERRFAEDKLRMLRAVRFAARFGFAIEKETMRAMQLEASAIAVVSAERVRDELTRILTEGHARRGVELLEEAGLLVQVLPEVVKMHGVAQPPQYHPEGDAWVHTMMLLDHLPRGASATLAWGMLLHDVGKPATFTPPDPAKPGDRIRFNGHVETGVAIARSILNRLRFSNEDSAQILALVKHHMQFGDVMKMKQSTLKRLLRLPLFEEHLALHFADASSASGNLELYAFAKKHYEEMGEEVFRPKLLLTGEDLIAAGYRPGPAFKKMLEVTEDAQLEGALGSKEQALVMVRGMFGEP